MLRRKKEGEEEEEEDQKEKKKKEKKRIRELIWKGAVVRSRLWELSVLSAQFFVKPQNSL